MIYLSTDDDVAKSSFLRGFAAIEETARTEELGHRRSRLADYAGDNQALTAPIASRTSRISVLQTLADGILALVARGEPWSEVLGALGHGLEALSDGCFCGVLLVGPDRKHFRLGAGPGLPRAYVDLIEAASVDGGDTPYSASVIAKARIITADLASDPRWPRSSKLTALKTIGFCSCCAWPILSASGEVRGVIAIHRTGPMTPTAQEERMIDRIARIAGVAIDRSLEEETLNRVRSELAHVGRVATLNAMSVSIGHELRQPLSAILTNAGACLRMLAADPPNLAGALETVRRTMRDVDRASKVIGHLRAMVSKTASPRETVDVNEAALEVIALSAGELMQCRALLQVDLAEDLPPVRCDRVQLQQVIMNLILNAADAMAEIADRPRALVVRTGLHDDGGVRLAVRDAGVGVDPGAVEKLFEAFYTTKAQGMGVGLSISRTIIESHHGRIWAEVNDGPGATFSFCLPAFRHRDGQDASAPLRGSLAGSM